MPHGFKEWSFFLVAQAILTFVWHWLAKLAENAMLTWSGDQIATFLGFSAPLASTIIAWTIPACLGFLTLLAYHALQPYIYPHKGATVVIDCSRSLANPSIPPGAEEKRELITNARNFVTTTIRQDPGYAYFQHALETSEIYLKLRPYLSDDFHHSLTSGRVIVASPLASKMPGIAWNFIREIERLEKQWNLTL